MDSNPTPCAYLGDLYLNFKCNEKKNYSRTKNLAQSLDHSEQERNRSIINKNKSITKSCLNQYFNSILIKLTNDSNENSNTICDYILSDETELNIKNSTKEERIKVLKWCANYQDNKKSFRDMTKSTNRVL